MNPIVNPSGPAMPVLLCLAALAFAAPAVAATDYVIDGGGAMVHCASNPQLTGRKFGNSPTVTGCVLSGDSTFGLPPVASSAVCKGGQAVAFYPTIGKLRSCTLSTDQFFLNTANARTACKAGGAAQFREDGRLLTCVAAGPPTAGGGGPGGGQPPGNKPPQPPQPPSQQKPQSAAATVVTPGESAKLGGAGQYTKIGASSNRPGSRGGYLYLGDGRATASYTVNAPAAGKYALWIRFDDDGKHAPGARGVEISVNGALALRWSNPSQDTKGWVNIPVGTVDLRAGANTVVFTKAATTSAAFVLDEFMLSSVPGYKPQ